MKILVAEDEKRMNRALCEIIRQEGYEVASVDNGEDALAEIESGVYDLIVLDVMMPRMSGYYVAKKARAAGVRTPILMLTAKSELDDKVEAIEQKPAKRWDGLVDKIVLTVVAALIGFALARLGVA